MWVGESLLSTASQFTLTYSSYCYLCTLSDACLFARWSISCLSVVCCLSYPSVCMSVHVCMSVGLSVCPVFLSVCLFVSLLWSTDRMACQHLSRFYSTPIICRSVLVYAHPSNGFSTFTALSVRTVPMFTFQCFLLSAKLQLKSFCVTSTHEIEEEWGMAVLVPAQTHQ